MSENNTVKMVGIVAIGLMGYYAAQQGLNGAVLYACVLAIAGICGVAGEFFKRS